MRIGILLVSLDGRIAVRQRYNRLSMCAQVSVRQSRAAGCRLRLDLYVRRLWRVSKTPIFSGFRYLRGTRL